MELLFVALAGAVLGLAARYFLPHRHTHGAVLIPALGVMVASALWVVLTWTGMKWNGGWIWWITLVSTAVVVFVVDVILGRIRTLNDERMLARLSKAAPVR
jgi:ABC-type branched-subunit amino acid transport system permease subunit